jgi:hypothetical protein
MNQDKEAVIVLALGILFCVIIIITSYSMDNSASQTDDQGNDEKALIQFGFLLIDSQDQNNDNFIDS